MLNTTMLARQVSWTCGEVTSSPVSESAVSGQTGTRSQPLWIKQQLHLSTPSMSVQRQIKGNYNLLRLLCLSSTYFSTDKQTMCIIQISYAYVCMSDCMSVYMSVCQTSIQHKLSYYVHVMLQQISKSALNLRFPYITCLDNNQQI